MAWTKIGMSYYQWTCNIDAVVTMRGRVISHYALMLPRLTATGLPRIGNENSSQYAVITSEWEELNKEGVVGLV